MVVPSYVWRSIIATQGLIRFGARKRIGSGRNVQIWNSPWLPDHDNPYIESSCPPGLIDAAVDSLRSSSNGYWDVDILKDLFNERDQQLILSILLGRQALGDNWMWFDDPKGAYTVKSVYKIFTKNHLVPHINSGINWNYIWNMKIPAKLRNFIWRALSSCLPTKKALQNRRVNVTEWYPLCHNEPEDDFHALISCPYAYNVWCLSPIGSHVGAVYSFVDWWNLIVSSRTRNEVEFSATLLWSLWMNRNEVVWQGTCNSAPSILHSAMDLISTWQQANQLNANQQNTSPQLANKRWKKPPAGSVKCNVDATTFSDRSFAGFGCVLRDSQGTLLAATHGRIPCRSFRNSRSTQLDQIFTVPKCDSGI